MNPLTARWAARGGSEWLEHYWQSSSAPHRGVIEEAVERLAPFTSLVEIGSNCGPNLRRLSARWPDARYLGLDANKEAVVYGNAKTAAGEFGPSSVAFWHVDDFGLTLMAHPRNQGPDVYLACYALSYADPETLWRIFALMATRKSLKGLVLAEPMGAGEPVTPTGLGAIDEWHHDYLSLVSETWPGARVTSYAVEPPADRLTTVLTVEVNP